MHNSQVELRRADREHGGDRGCLRLQKALVEVVDGVDDSPEREEEAAEVGAHSWEVVTAWA